MIIVNRLKKYNKANSKKGKSINKLNQALLINGTSEKHVSYFWLGTEKFKKKIAIPTWKIMGRTIGVVIAKIVVL